MTTSSAPRPRVSRQTRVSRQSSAATGGGQPEIPELDVLVLGSGVAGLTAALVLASRGLRLAVITKGELTQSATRYAQGGVAAALSEADSPELHLSDTLAAGAGLCDPEAVRVLVGEGPDRVIELLALGAVFDREGSRVRGGDPAAGLAMAREGGHSLARVVHAGGDATGSEMERALVAAVREAVADLREGCLVLDLLVERGRCVGVLAAGPDGSPRPVRAGAVVLATGGAGQLYSVTTNPSLSTADGVAMALRAGVAVADLEFVQFHPTALHHPAMPRPLLSEALRGEGAVLRDDRGAAFLTGVHPLGDLAPRDVVAQAIARCLAERGLDHVWLDATGIAGFEARFPTIWKASRRVGLDPRHEWLPVAPAAHYLCGGVLTDLEGATSLPGLWACGEVACTGAHGANRLASNSLLEGLVYGRRAALAVSRGEAGPGPTGAMRALFERALFEEPGPAPGSSPRRADGAPLRPIGRADVQAVMTQGAGIVRDASGLAGAIEALGRLRRDSGIAPSGSAPSGTARSGPGPADFAEQVAGENLLAAGTALVRAALAREESRGSHLRRDRPGRDPFPERIVHLGASITRVAAHPAGQRAR